MHFCSSRQRPMRVRQYALTAEDSDQTGLQLGKPAFCTLLREPHRVWSTDESSASEAQVHLHLLRLQLKCQQPRSKECMLRSGRLQVQLAFCIVS